MNCRTYSDSELNWIELNATKVSENILKQSEKYNGRKCN